MNACVVTDDPRSGYFVFAMLGLLGLGLGLGLEVWLRWKTRARRQVLAGIPLAGPWSAA